MAKRDEIAQRIQASDTWRNSLIMEVGQLYAADHIKNQQKINDNVDLIKVLDDRLKLLKKEYHEAKE